MPTWETVATLGFIALALFIACYFIVLIEDLFKKKWRR